MSVRVEKYYEDKACKMYTVKFTQSSNGHVVEFARVDKANNGNAQSQINRQLSGYWLNATQLIEISEALMKTIQLMQEPES